MNNQIERSAKVNGQRPFAGARGWATATMNWFPMWGQAIACCLLLLAREWTAAYMAAAETWFAFAWITDRKW